MPFECHDCFKSYQRSDYLSYHSKNAHGKPFRCNKCNKTFATMKELQPHKVQVHNCYPCENCNKSFSLKKALNSHSRSCTISNSGVIRESSQIESEIVDNETVVKIRPSKNNCDKEKPANVRSTEEPDSSDSLQRSESYGDNLDKDSLTEIDASDEKQLEIDKNLKVTSVFSLKSQINVNGENQTTNNVGNVEEHEFEFEQPLKKIKLEDQSGNEIQRLHETIKDLKDENLKLSKEVSDIKDLKVNIQKQSRDEIQRLHEIIENLKKDNLKLNKDFKDLKTNGQNQSRDEIQRLQTTIKTLKEDNVKLYKEVSDFTDLNVQVQKQAQIINTLKEKNLKLYEENANLKYGGQ